MSDQICGKNTKDQLVTLYKIVFKLGSDVLNYQGLIQNYVEGGHNNEQIRIFHFESEQGVYFKMRGWHVPMVPHQGFPRCCIILKWKHCL